MFTLLQKKKKTEKRKIKVKMVLQNLFLNNLLKNCKFFFSADTEMTSCEKIRNSFASDTPKKFLCTQSAGI